MRNRNFKSYASWAEQVLARMFYRHGVFCASHPMLMLSFSILIALVIGSPTVYKATKRLFWSTQVNEPDHFWDTPASREPVDEERFVQRFGKDPVLRIEQVVINASAVADNYVGVLEKPVLMYVLDLERRIERARASVDCAGVLFDHGTSLTAANLIEFGLGDICYKALGDNRCLVHTPLEFWSSNPDILSRDPDLLATLSTAPRLSSFGIPLPFSSVFTDIVTRNERKSDKFRNASLSSRELVSAGSIVITFFLKDLDAVQFGGCKTSDLWDKLWNDSILDHRSERGYGYAGAGAITRVDDPLERVWRGKGDVKHLYYQFGENVQRITSEHVVLAISYSLVFLYISLVLGRVDLVKSKFGLGAAAVCMVLYSFAMSIGLCEFLGVETSVLVPWEVLPFLIILMGVENIYVLTNAVVTTSLDLPVRERVGMGLGKVGLRMITSLTTEMSILLIGSAINIPALQEFCLFGAVSLVISFFMEVTFFVTVLAIDIRRLELSDLHKLRQPRFDVDGNDVAVDRKSTDSSGDVRSSVDLTENHDLEQSRGKKASFTALTILAIMVLLGMGIYGTSSGTSSDDLLPNMNDLRSGSRNDMSDKGESFLKEDSMAATARILWEVMNPNHTDTFLEVRPPTYVTFLGPNSSNTNRKQPKPDQRITTKYSTQSSSHSGTDQSRGPLSSPPPTDGSPPTRTSALNLFIQIVRSSTTIFIVAVVSFLLSTILACLGVTSFLQLCAAAVQQYKISLEEATRRSNGGKEGQVSPVLIWKAWIWMWRNGTRANRSVTFRSESESVPSSHPWIAGVGRILTLRGSPSTGISVADVLATESGKVYWADSNSNIRSWDVHSGVLDEIDLAAGVSTSERLTSSRATMGAPLVLSSVDGPSAYGSTQWSSFVAVGSGAGLLFSSEGGNLTPAKNSKHVMARLLPPITDVIASENQQTFLDYQSCHIIAGLGICSVFDRLVPCGAELWQIRSPMPTTHTNSATTTPYFEGANDNEFPFSAVESQPTPHVGETSWNVSYLGVLDVRNIPVESESLEDEKFTLVDTKTTDFLVTSLAVTRKGWILMGLGDGRMILWSPTSSTSDLASTQPNGIAPYTIILVQKCHSSAIASIAVCDVDTAAGDTAFSFVSTGDDTGVLSLHILKASMRSSMSSMQELWSSHSGRRRSFNRKAGLTKIERCDRSGQYQVTDTNRHSLDSTASSISTSSVLTRHEGRITKIILAREDGNPPDNRRKQSQKLWRPYGESLKEAVSSTTSSVMMVTAAEDEMVHVWQFQIVLDKSSSTTSAKSNQSSDFCELTAWNYIGSMNQNGCADCDLYDGLLIGVRRAEVDLNSSDSLRPRSSESLPSSKRSSLDVRYMTSSDDRGATDATESSNWRGLGLTWFSMRRRSTVGDWASQTAELRDWRWECWIVDLRNLLQRRRDEILMQRRQQALSQSMPKMTGLSYGSPAISGDSGDDTCSDRMRILVPDRTFVLGADGLRGYGRRLGLSNMRSRDEEWASILKQMDERRCFEMAPLDVGAEENGSGASRDKLDVQSDNGSEIDEVLPDCVLGVKKVKAVGWGIVCDFGEFVKVIAFNEDTWLSA